jgi:hypothetical protein
MRQALHNITIRRASGTDAADLDRLAALDSARSLSGDVLVADVGGELRAAVELTGGAVIADPFSRTADVVELLRVRAARMRDERRHRGRGLGRLRTRSATELA